jgi:hypothetical protein
LRGILHQVPFQTLPIKYFGIIHFEKNRKSHLPKGFRVSSTNIVAVPLSIVSFSPSDFLNQKNNTAKKKH